MLQHLSYILLDAARMGPVILEAKTRNKIHDSLYRGRSEESLSGVAPYIFQFAHPTSFSNWYLRQGWGHSWGLMIKSSWPLSELHKHFRKFLLVKTESGEELYFRFYDPRVLRIFLPTCDADQIRELFGDGIDAFVVEDDDPEFALRFRHENGVLHTERLNVGDLIRALPDPEPLPPTDEEPLPPETIAALRELEIEPSQKESGTTPAPAAPPEAAAAIASEPMKSAEEPPTPTQKPKSKWNMFD